MRRYFSNLLTPRTATSENEVQYWRERIVALTLFGAVLVGSAAYAINMVLAFQNGTWGWAIVYTAAFVSIAIIAFSPNLPYTLRASVMLFMLYAFGIISGLQYGTAGDTRVWLLGFIILTALFLGAWQGFAAAIFSLATLISMGWAMNRGIVAPPDITGVFEPVVFSSWISTSIPVLAVSVLIILCLGAIVNGLNRSLQRGRQLATDLEADRQRLERRTQELERREVQVRTAAEISRTISAELDPERLFQQVVDLVQERFNLYYVGVFLIDTSGLYAVLRAGTGIAGEAMIASRHSLPIGGTSMIGWSISRRQARIALDVGQDAVRFENPHLPETRSELALPMISGPQVLGALTIQSAEAEAFDQDDIIVLQGVADGLATALENARLFQQSQTNLAEIQRLHQQYLGEAWTQVIAKEQDLIFSFESQAAATADDSAQVSRISHPLVLRDQVIGNIQLESNQGPWTPEDQAFVEAVSTQAALALENVRLVEETQRTAQHDRIVSELTGKAWTSTNIDTILQTTLSELGQTLQATDGLIQLETTDPE